MEEEEARVGQVIHRLLAARAEAAVLVAQLAQELLGKDMLVEMETRIILEAEAAAPEELEQQAQAVESQLVAEV